VVVSYVPGTLSVRFDGKRVHSVPLRLTKIGLGHDRSAYLGFTAGTGDASETNDILRYRFVGAQSQP
jgi:hypothetical protein